MKAYGVTHVGMVRSANQDMFLTEQLSATTGLAIVCDGMGGPGGGQIASDIAVKTLAKVIREGHEQAQSEKDWKELIQTAVRKANGEIFKYAAHEQELTGMGTTMVLAIYGKEKALVANIGDSRAYVTNGGHIDQVTKDHSVVQQMVDEGQLTKFEAKVHPKKNIITRALGVDLLCEADFFEVTLEQGDYLLLCSDGLTGYVDENELAFELSVCDKPEEVLDKFVLMANERGGSDNITAVLVVG